MTTWNQRKHKHRHGDMVHAHINGYTCHEHSTSAKILDREAHESTFCDVELPCGDGCDKLARHVNRGDGQHVSDCDHADSRRFKDEEPLDQRA